MFRNLNFLIASFVCVAFLSVATCAALDKTKFKLRFKPTGARKLKLVITIKSDIYETSWERVRVHTLFEETNVYACKVQKTDNNLLKVKTKHHSFIKKVNGHVFKEERTRGSDVSSFVMNSKGERVNDISGGISGANEGVDKGPVKAIESKIELLFPERALAVGDKWQIIIPPSENYPEAIKVQFEVSKFVKRSSANFCVISMSYETSLVSLERSCRMKVDSKSRIVFNVSNGYVMRQTGSNSSITTWLKRGADNPFQSASFTKMKTVLQ